MSLLLFYSLFFYRRMPRPFDVALVAILLLLSCDWGADAECANCERRINEWCCETGWRGSCCEFPLQGGRAGLGLEMQAKNRLIFRGESYVANLLWIY